MADTSDYEEARAAAQQLSALNEKALFTELGKRIGDITNIGGWERAHQYDARFQEAATELGFTDDLTKVGKLWWAKLQPQLMGLICDPKNTDLRTITAGRDLPTVAAGLATAAVISALAPPAWIIVATSILAAKITQSGLDAICAVWGSGTQATSPAPATSGGS